MGATKFIPGFPSFLLPALAKKPSQFAPCISTTTGQDVVLAAGTYVLVGGVIVPFLSATVATIDTGALAAGTDYAIYACINGTVVFSANFVCPAGWTAGQVTQIGGFHYAPGGNGKVVAAVGYGDGTHMSIGSTPQRVATTASYFSIAGGALTLKAADAVGVALPAQTVPMNTWALHRFSIIANGTVTVTPAALNTTGYATEALAIAALPAVPANSAARGYITVLTATGQTFIANTDALAGGAGGHPATTTNYYPESSTGAQINPYSIWDLKFRPKCQDPRGMFLDLDCSWKDIYLLGTNPDVDGTSKFGATIADGSSPPRIPAAFGGNGTTAYAGLTRYNAAEVGAAYGKQLLCATEFETGAFGIQEATALGFDPVTVSGGGPRTSQRGMIQATGNMLVWGRDMNFIPHTTALGGSPPADADQNTWINAALAPAYKASGRGQVYAYGNNGLAAALFGGYWSNGSYAGSRCSGWDIAPWASFNNRGARFRSDHLCLP